MKLYGLRLFGELSKAWGRTVGPLCPLLAGLHFGVANQGHTLCSSARPKRLRYPWAGDTHTHSWQSFLAAWPRGRMLVASRARTMFGILARELKYYFLARLLARLPQPFGNIETPWPCWGAEAISWSVLHFQEQCRFSQGSAKGPWQ